MVSAAANQIRTGQESVVQLTTTSPHRTCCSWLARPRGGAARTKGLSERKVDKEDAERKEAEETAIAEKQDAENEG